MTRSIISAANRSSGPLAVPTVSRVRPTWWRHVARVLAVLAVVALLTQVVPAASASPARENNVVIQWNKAALQGVRNSNLGPPAVSRAVAIVHTCIYDAWAAYDPRAVGTRLGGGLRRPLSERTLANKNEAISYAAHRAAVDLFPGDAAMFDHLLVSLGYRLARTTNTNTATPSGIGNVACRAVLDYRHHDGSNQLGDLAPGPYSDYTGYRPVNSPMVLPGFDPRTVHDPDRWQPLTYTDASGKVVTPNFLQPHWNRVTPFALTSGAQYRSPTGPAQFGSYEYVGQARRLLDISANLTDRQKVIAEYWRNGPNAETASAHWDLFAQFVSRRDGHGLNETGVDADVKMFFALNNALFDAGIVAWDNKRAYDSVRPITAVRHLFRGQNVRAWGGPGKGPRLIRGESWLPYYPSTLPTPPFPEYSSGHSNFGAAAAEILKLATGSDAFGASVTIPAGSSTIEPGVTPARPVTLSWTRFSDAADENGISRLYGGVHFQQGNVDALSTGRQVGRQAWAKALTYFEGSARR